MSLLEDADVEKRMKELKDWVRDGEFISKDFTFQSFPEAIAFIVQVGFLAEEQGHHPNLSNVYTNVTIKFSTHDAGGLTEKDFAMASAVDAL